MIQIQQETIVIRRKIVMQAGESDEENLTAVTRPKLSEPVERFLGCFFLGGRPTVYFSGSINSLRAL